MIAGDQPIPGWIERWSMANRTNVIAFLNAVETNAQLTNEGMKAAKSKIELVQELICDCYCKFPEEYLSMYKDPDVAFDNLDREKCDVCPLKNL